ncbi:MAG: hypothetical protein GC154_11005 [bacterium]|nr:hypothetical protein [bacterium]
MVSAPSPIGSIPVVNYRPDPGEPAARLNAPQTQTAGLVTIQEQRNETRLRAQALARGEDIIYSNRTFTLGVGNVSPVYVGGLTTVVTQSDSNGFAPDFQPQPASASDNPINQAQQVQQTDSEKQSKQDQGLAPKDPEETAEPTKQELQQKKREIETDEQRLDRNLTLARLQQRDAIDRGDPAQFEQANRKENQLKREQEQVDRDKRENELKLLEKRSQTGASDTALPARNQGNGSGVLDVLFGFNQPGRDQSGQPSAAPRQGSGGPGFFSNGPRVN